MLKNGLNGTNNANINVYYMGFNSHTIITYLNILFYVSLIIFISIFLILLVQEGIFDATSYGFRRLKYQMSSSKRRSLSLMIHFSTHKR